MSRTGDSFGKRDVKSKKDHKRKEKEKKRLERKDTSRKNSPDDMIAYVDENGMITSERPDPGKKTVIAVEDIIISPPKKTELTEADLERKGKLTSFIQSKGYGFIRASDSQESFFAHIKDFMEEINEGDTVMFQVMRGPKGYSAVKVRLCPK